MSRPTKLTDERVAGVLAGIKLGQSHSQAARAVGISHNTIRNWAQRSPVFTGRVAARAPLA